MLRSSARGEAIEIDISPDGVSVKERSSVDGSPIAVSLALKMLRTREGMRVAKDRDDLELRAGVKQALEQAHFYDHTWH